MIMSSADKPANDEVCASCGIKEGGDNDVKLKTCTACKLVKYCSVECQRKHRSRHKRACKRRATELRDELLFKQPECTHLGECPICFVPIPYESNDGRLMSAGLHLCCSKFICTGCIHESVVQGLERKCPFCRTPNPNNDTEAQKLADKQLKRGNPAGLRHQACICKEEGDHGKSFEYMREAAKSDDAIAHHELGHMYMYGKGVEKDLKKGVFHLEQAAIGGHPKARVTLGIIESTLGSNERAVKHFIIAAKQGSKEAFEQLREGYKDGNVNKEAFDEGLRGYENAVNAMETPQREAAKKQPDLISFSRLS